MIAVDTNILVDVLTEGSPFSQASKAALAKERRKGALVICEIVYAELAAHFSGDRAETDQFLERADIAIEPSDRAVLTKAGELWRAYRLRGGKKERMVADFMIGAHAAVHVGALLTRDAGFYRGLFQKLRVVDPMTASKKGEQ